MPQNQRQQRNRYAPTTARGPRVGVLGALLLHGLIVAGAVFSWQHKLDIADEATPIVPVDLVTIAEKTNIAPSVTLPTRIEPPSPPTDKPTPVPAKPQPAEALPDLALSQPIVPKPSVAPKPAARPPEPAPQPKKPQADDFSALLNKLTAPAAASRRARTADRTLSRVGAMNAMTMDLSDALKNQIAQCWSPPVGAPHPEQLIPVFRLFLGPDGRVVQAPQLTADSAARATSDPFMRAAAEAARRAIYTCAPYKLPAAKYDVWRDITVDFDPRRMFQ